jgi:Transposase, Mutator family
VWRAAKSRSTRSLLRAYASYSIDRRTLVDLSQQTGLSIRTLQRKFDAYTPPVPSISIATQPVALTFDGTFFGRGYGVLVYRAQGRNIHWQDIETERLVDVDAGLRHLKAQGWIFSSVTIDGRKGFVSLIKKHFPHAPVQMCLFHQKATIRRYLTGKPKTLCAKELHALVAFLGHISETLFMDCLADLQTRYAHFLKERNDAGQFMHRRLRSALRSLRSNAPYLFTHLNAQGIHIPTTTNSCDGSFAHWKAKVKIHRGLKQERRNKMIRFLLANT